MPGRSLQLKPEQKNSIKALLSRNSFPSQQALADHLGLSRDVVSRFLNSKPIDRLNAEEICQALNCDVREVTYMEETKPKETKIDWGEATNNDSIFQLSTRTKQLENLKQWIIEDKCRIIFIEGMKGMGKTNLSYQLANEIKNDFDYIILRSLDQYQSIDELLKDLLLFLNDEEDIKALDTKQKLANLIENLKIFRCLLIVTNIDWAIEQNSLNFRDQNYNFFLKELAEKQDKSCLVMTGKIEPKEIDFLVAQNQWSRCLKIEPLSVESIKNIFNRVGLFEGAEEDWKKLRDTYWGNHIRDNLRKLSRCQENSKSDWGRMGKERLTLS